MIMNFSKVHFLDNVWIVSPIKFAVPNSHSNINPGTGVSNLYPGSLLGRGLSVEFFLNS